MDDFGVLICPRCHGEWEIDSDDDLFYANDTEDRCTTPCPGCGAKLIVDAELFVKLTAKEATLED